jgi:drug/metabolite transporter (DMT)-like permease
MNHTHDSQTPRVRFLTPFLGGCAGIAGSFFLWLGLLAEKPLSFLYPLRSLNTVVIALGAVIFLREKLTPRLLLSIVLVTIGVGLVLGS